MASHHHQRQEKRRDLSPMIQERNQLLLDHLGLVHLAARRQQLKGPESYEDLVQESCLGALAALERFDPSRGLRPSTYVLQCANGQILHYRRDRARTIRIPWRQRDLVARGMKLQQQRRELDQPILSDLDLARALNVSLIRWQSSLQAVSTTSMVSLNQQRGGHEVNKAHELITQISASPSNVDQQREWLLRVIADLEPDQQQWLQAYYVDRLSLRAIAERFEISATVLKQQLQTIVRMLKRWAERDGQLQPLRWPEQPPEPSAAHSPTHW